MSKEERVAAHRAQRRWLVVATATLLPAASAHADGEVPLADLVAYAEQHAPAVLAAAASRSLGDAELRAAEPLLAANPHVELGIGPRFTSQSDVLDFDIVVALSQALEVAGERGTRQSIAMTVRARIDAEIEEVRALTRAAVVASYRRAQVAAHREAVSARAVALANETLSTTRLREARGESTVLETHVALAELASARAEQSRVVEGSRTERLRLATLVGWPVERDTPTPTRELPPPRTIPDAAVLLASLRERHPELRALAATAAEAEARRVAADRSAWPNPVIGASLAREGSAGSPANFIVLGTLGLTIPVWQQNDRDRASAAAANEMVAARQIAAEHRLHASLRALLLAIESAGDRVRLADELRTPRAESLSLLERAFAAGEINVIDLVGARERIVRAELDELAAREELEVAVATLEALTGTTLEPTSTTRGEASR